MKRYEQAELETMKPAFIKQLPQYYRDCGWPEEADNPDAYGVHEWDRMEAVIIDDDGKVTVDTGERRIVRDADCETWIESGDMTWVGDDVDYHDAILSYFQELHGLLK
jgi:hypothetical protein